MKVSSVQADPIVSVEMKQSEAITLRKFMGKLSHLKIEEILRSTPRPDESPSADTVGRVTDDFYNALKRAGL